MKQIKKHKRENDNLFFLIMGIIFFVLFLCFLFLVLREVNEQNIRMIFIGLFLMTGILAVIWGIYLRRRIIRLTDSTCMLLDHMMSEEEIKVEQYHDTMPEKLSGKLYQFYAMAQHNREKTQCSEQEIKEIISDISHQVKTPIANVKMFTGILQEREMSQEKRQEFLAHIESQVDKLAFLMEALIKMSRLEAGIFSLHMEKARLSDTVAEALNHICMKAEQKQIEISVSGDMEIEVLHDRKWTAEAVFNVLDNAVKYSEERTKISLYLSKGEFYTRLDVADQGKGISEKHYSAIFQRFYREEDVAQKEGVGLGLYLVREIMTLQKGYVSVKSGVGEGSVFSFYFLNDANENEEGKEDDSIKDK